MLRTTVVAVFALLLPALGNRLRADFHFMHIEELMTQANGDPRIQFIEFQMDSPAQGNLTNHDIFFYDAHGNLTGSYRFTDIVDNDDNDATILVGTQAFAAVSSEPPDFIMPEGLMSPFAGRVTFEGEGEAIVDSVAYGAFDGSNAGFGTAAPGFPVLGVQSLTRGREALPRDNSMDFSFAVPSPQNNADANAGTMTIPARTCYVTDNFADMSKWDQPEPNAGLDLTGCGLPSGIDIGTVEVVGNKLIFVPGEQPLGNLGPIALTGLKQSVADTIGNPNHRARFNMMAVPGVVTGATFIHQRYFFDDAASLLDVAEAAGLGMNFSFDDFEEISDHLHADVRLSCLQEGDVDGADDADYPGYTLKSNTLYTVIMDVDGDSENGPLTLQVKLYPAVEAEPTGHLAAFTMGSGLGPISDESLFHGMLIAALGTSQGELQITDFSICEIPRNQKSVRELTCLRNEDGSVSVAWSNPFDAEEEDIVIRVNGEEVDTAAPNATTITIDDPPAGDLVIAVVNYSGTPVECTVCENNPPVPMIDGPSQVTLVDGTATVTLDSAASTDGDDGTQGLTRLWEVVAAPAGGTASIDDQGAIEVNVNVNAPGEYRVRLTLVDGGCTGSVGLTEILEHTFTAGEPSEGGLQKPGDENQDGAFNLSDPISILNHLFAGTNPTLPCGDGTVVHAANLALLDLNGDGSINLSDPIFGLNFLFVGGTNPKPVNCADASCPCIQIEGCANDPSGLCTP